MIVGSGLLARSFAPLYGNADHDVVVFASGVSNSLETGSSAFARERRLLEAALARRPRRLVYFGTCGVANPLEPPTPYMQHKLDMESLVVARTGGLVLRLPQAVGVTANPHTLTNYLHDRILSGACFSLWAKAERNIIDIDAVAAIAAVMIEANDPGQPVLTIAAERSMPMPAIVDIFERVLGRRANYVMQGRGTPLPVDSARAVEIARHLGIDLGPGHAERVIRKYYGPH